VPKSTDVPFIRTLALPSEIVRPVPPVAFSGAADEVPLVGPLEELDAPAFVPPEAPLTALLDAPAAGAPVDPEALVELWQPLTASGVASAAAHSAALAHVFRPRPTMTIPPVPRCCGLCSKDA